MTTRIKAGFYLYRFLTDFTPIYVLYPIFFKSIGLEEALISVLFMTLTLSMLVSELPSGVIADKIDRRIVLAFSAITKALGFLIWLLWPHPIGFAAGMILWGLGTSFESGCWQAFIYDELASQKKEHEFNRLLASMFGVSFAAVLLSSLAGAVIFYFHQNYFLIILTSVVASCLAGIIPIIFPKATPDKTVAPLSFKKHLTEALRVWRLRPSARWIILSAAILGGVKGSLDEYHGLYLSEKLIDTSLIPVFYAGFMSVGMVVFFILSSKTRTTTISHLTFFMVGIGFLLFSVAFLPTWAAIISLLILNAFDSVFRVDNESLLQASIISNSMRATITSTVSFSQQVVSLLVFGASSFIAAHSPLRLLYILGGTVLVGVALHIINENQKLSD